MTPDSRATTPLLGRGALVTGASRGIGRAIAVELATLGADVAINFRANQEAAKAVAQEVEALGRRSTLVQADVSDPAQASAAVAQAIDALGAIDILVNNAGITRDGLIYQMEARDWQDVMAVNFGGVVNSTLGVLDHMMTRGSGVIVNISSVMADRAWLGNAAYASAKAAVNAFTRAAAHELARFGIRVHAVLPGFIDTEMVAGLTSQDGGEGIIQQIPMRAIGLPQHVAQVVGLLATLGDGYVTGTFVTVDGGAMVGLGLGRPLRRPPSRG